VKRQKDTAKPPGRLATAARRKARHAVPYAAGLAVALAAALMLHSLAPFWVAIGLAAMHAGLRLHEAAGIRRNGGKRAARQRRRFQGIASEWELRTLSLRVARKRARVTRPQTPGRLPAHEAGVHIGRSRWLRRRLAVTHEDSVLVLGGVRMGKSGWLAGAVWDAPGAALVTSTRIDLYKNTAVARRERGPVLVLNPDGYGGIPSTLKWSPLDGCETPAGASAAAGYLMAAAPQDEGKDAFWLQQAHDLMRLMMHAAALDGATILDVRDWVSDLSSLEALTILDNHPLAEPRWANELAAIQMSDDGADALKSVQSTARSALAWLSDPAMAAVASAPPGEWLDMEAFIESGGTVYLVGADRPHAPLSPYFACFTGQMFETAKKVAAGSPGSRLDPPLTFALDEAALLKAPLDRISAEAGGHGITWLAAVQSPSQLKQCWGEHGGRIVWDNATCKLIFGGLTGHEDLEAISAVCGERDTYDVVKGPDGKKVPQPPRQERTVKIEQIRLIPPGKALALYRATRPFFPQLRMVWDRPGYTPATVNPVTAPLVPLDGTVMAPAIPGHLSGPMYAATAPARAVAVPATRPALEEQQR
jgi:type IV secretion system protein VirD4